MITKHIINILRITPAIVPSPFGANSLIIIINRFLEVVNCLHSLLGGNLSILVCFCNNKYNFQFPCPSGVFIFSIVNALDKYFELTLLPSPSGGSIFSITTATMVHEHYTVSVPFRGFYLLNTAIKLMISWTKSVSVPFRGFYLLNQEEINFRGEMPKRVSVPFRGFYLLNKLNETKEGVA